MPQDEVQMLKRAAEGLLYPSESDEPFEVFCWKGPNAKQAVLSHAKQTSPVVEQSVEGFFDALKGSEDWLRYEKLWKLMESILKGLKVFRVGQIEVEVFVVGQSAQGDWMGVKTVSVET